jgi:RNA polymerase sigma-70 factor (ECF subfamily)
VHDQLPGHLLSVYRFAMYLCGDQHVAEDLTQEAMLRALRNLQSLNDPTTLKIWLFRIVKNLWTDKCRSRSQQATYTLNDEELAGIESERVTVAEMEEEVARTLEAMQNLPRRQREVLHLIACQHFSIAEVAGVLEISPEAVRSSLSLARAQMRKMVYPNEFNSLPQCKTSNKA